MTDIEAEFESKVQEYEAGVADLLAAYDAAEAPYLAAVSALTPVAHWSYASNSSARMPNVNMG